MSQGSRQPGGWPAASNAADDYHDLIADSPMVGFPARAELPATATCDILGVG
jgi:hypothetical protein